MLCCTVHSTYVHVHVVYYCSLYVYVHVLFVLYTVCVYTLYIFFSFSCPFHSGPHSHFLLLFPLSNLLLFPLWFVAKDNTSRNLSSSLCPFNVHMNMQSKAYFMLGFHLSLECSGQCESCFGWEQSWFGAAKSHLNRERTKGTHVLYVCVDICYDMQCSCTVKLG